MKIKKIIFMLLLITILISCIQSVNATDVSAKLKPSATTLKQGETFTLTISGTCSDGLATFTTAIQYDKDVLEIVNGAVVDSNNWFEISSGGNSANGYNVMVMTNSRENITSADLYAITFKVKNTAKAGDTIISAGTITIDSNADSNSISTIDGETVTINITDNGSLIIGQATLSEIKIETPPTKTVYNVGENFNPSGMVIKAKYSDGTEKEVKDYKYSPAAELLETYSKITITYTENGVTKTATQNITINLADKEGGNLNNNTTNTSDNNIIGNKDNTKTNNSIADTGIEDHMGLILIVLTIIVIASYAQYLKYKNF